MKINKRLYNFRQTKVFVKYLEVKTQVSEYLKEYYCNEDVIFGTSICDATNDSSASDDIGYADATSSEAIIGEASAATPRKTINEKERDHSIKVTKENKSDFDSASGIAEGT
ncbi:hypothetical protein G6F70_002325 [Rhizopus microsporus]|nr:hypothetical protein G6F71_002444 [Rhizopus microsporus]KAG1202379.1 hypothetical protein G6F70_002325 [Rhizopus microsporus]KAG1214183.1 hypothetical protein G6F69_002167 [Rhizopus microsporus]KAG1236656.1 hypothetical protein G6F67_001834 [Rhizopus microsporus]KAG1268416.1 hypothetical protein G6F68_001141 [Rhizopus microsporus]